MTDPLLLAFVGVALFAPYVGVGVVVWMCRTSPDANDMRVIRRVK